MNKGELVEAVAGKADISKADAARALDAFVEVVTKSIKKKDPVTLVGFGTFDVARSKARLGRNPKTGEQIKIKAKNSPKFRAGKALKDALN